MASYFRIFKKLIQLPSVPSGMEKLSLSNLVSSANSCFFLREHPPCKLSKRYPQNFIHDRKFCIQMRYPRLFCYSKSSDYQDFQGYARPSRLLPVTETASCTHSSLEELCSSSRVDESQSLYMVKLQTSPVSGSDLSDLNAGMLLCLIDENGDSVLQRITATSDKRPLTKETAPDFLPFQRGSVDEFIFEGPKMGKIEALWIGPQSGHWRLGAVTLMVINGCGELLGDQTELEDPKPISYCGTEYDFDVEDIHLGQVKSMSMVELRPCHVTELSNATLIDLLKTGLSHSTLLLNREITTISKEESMREYADLKSSLLLYDAVLILAGTSITSIFIGEKAGLAYLSGGAGGFFYLMLLQRSVDGIPGEASISMMRDTGTLDQLFRQLKTPISSLVLAFVFAVIAVKYQSGASPVMLTPQELLLGMTGFLACKIAIVLAALKPVPSKLENK